MLGTPNNFHQGDILYLNFSPQSGHEQKGPRPAIVVSNDIFNSTNAHALVCPITNTDRSHPLHVPLDDRTQPTGVIMADQIRSLDVISGGAKYVESAPEDIVSEILDIVSDILRPEDISVSDV